MDAGVLRQGRSVLDYGCGRGRDVSELRRIGYDCAGWDPSFRAAGPKRPSAVVNLGFVINVIENPEERSQALKDAWAFAENVLVVAAQLTFDAKRTHVAEHEDGVLTSRGTFQKYYTQRELREYIDTTLEVQSVPAAPGVFLVFRDAAERQSVLAARYRRRSSIPKKRLSDILFEQHAGVLDHLMRFVTDRGRLPEDWELPEAAAIKTALGSIRQAFRVVLRVTGEEQWQTLRAERVQDLLLYLALERFGGRPRYSELSPDLRVDVREFFGNYTRACEEADKLLFAAGDMDRVSDTCRSSPLGKQTPEALYVHASALDNLSHLLRVYEGCARAYIGSLEAANVVKLHRDRPQVSYLCYPKFDRDPHPALIGSLLVDMQRLQVEYRDYSAGENPPILHRKEEFVGQGYPLHGRFSNLTQQEERFGLYEDTSLIGNRDGWMAVLDAKRLALRGHRVVRNREVVRQPAGADSPARTEPESAEAPRQLPASPGPE
jgi:DNA phosphorothioation-associated putative methyltransferase